MKGREAEDQSPPTPTVQSSLCLHKIELALDLLVEKAYAELCIIKLNDNTSWYMIKFGTTLISLASSQEEPLENESAS